MKDNILSSEFSAKSLVGYVVPTIIMMVFMSSYSIVDGIFVSQLIGEDALSAVNLVMPMISIAMAIALMFGTGGSAVVARLMGEQKELESKQFFTLIYLVGTIVGGILTAFILLFRHNILDVMGATGVLGDYALDYLVVIALFVVAFFWQVFTQIFFVTAGKPIVGFAACLLGGLTNIALDYVFMAQLDLGISGAALATGIGAAVPGIFGFIYFFFNKKSSLKFTKPVFNFKLLFESMGNGASELVGNLSVSITTLMFNFILLKLAGSNGVAAISVILYIQMLQTAVYMGYSTGVSPIVSYKYGERNEDQLKTINKISFRFIGIVSIITVILSILFANPIVSVFIDPSSETFVLATTGLKIFSIAYLFMGYNIFASAMFTALSNGRISAILAGTRSLVFIIIALLILPAIFGVTGVWLAIPIAEACAIILSWYFYKKYKSYYQY